MHEVIYFVELIQLSNNVILGGAGGKGGGETPDPYTATVKKIISGSNVLALTLYLQLEMY